MSKELRSASRRWRLYLLRSGYLGLLTLYVVLAYAGTMVEAGNSATAVARMADVGKELASLIVLFQFVATQAVALLMGVGALQEEIDHRTLPAVLAAPVGEGAFILGKVLARVWQVLVLVALTFPLLALIRVLGGVTSGFVVSSLVITLLGALLTASLGAWFSLRQDGFAGAAILTGLWLVGYALVAGLGVGMVVASFDGPTAAVWWCTLAGPHSAIVASAAAMADPSVGSAPPWLLAVSAVVWLVAVRVFLQKAARLIRLVGLGRVQGVKPRPLFRYRPPPDMDRYEQAMLGLAAESGRDEADGEQHKTDRRRRRPVNRAELPLLWKERLTPLFQSERTWFTVITLTVAPILASYFLAVSYFLHRQVHAWYVFAYIHAGLVITTIAAGRLFTGERQAGTLVGLLTTPMSTWRILGEKALAVFWHGRWPWGVMLVHLALVTVTGVVNLFAALLTIVIAASAAGLMVATGAALSIRLRRVTTAMVANLAIAAGLWVVLPVLLAQAGRLGNSQLPIGPEAINPGLLAESWVAEMPAPVPARGTVTGMDLGALFGDTLGIVGIYLVGAGLGALLAGRAYRRRGE